jgi:hypothetical protein
MAVVTLPTRTDGYPAYDFEVELDGRAYVCVLRWNEREGSWYLSLLDADRVDIVAGVRVVVDWDLLRRVVDARRPPGVLIAVDTTSAGEPGLTDLGGRVLLTYEDLT